jgi:hypothetical protein
LAKVIDLPARSLNDNDGPTRSGRRRRSASGVAE